MFHLLRSSFVYFISGIFVAISVNLITSNPTNFLYGEGAISLLVSSTPWMTCAVFLTILAIILESAENDYSSCTLNSLTSKEQKELRQSIYSKYTKKLIIYSMLIFISFSIGIFASVNNIKVQQPLESKDKISTGSVH